MINFKDLRANGVPVLGGGLLPQIPAIGGKVLFVDGTNGADGNPGDSPDQALATIARAHTLCTSGRGDVIVVFPGTYAENVVITKNHVTLVSAFAGRSGWASIAPTSGVALVVDDASGFTAHRIKFASVAQDSDLVRVEGIGFGFHQCLFEGALTMGDAKALLRLWPDAATAAVAASNGIIDDCRFKNSGGLGLVFDCQNATVPTLPTDILVRNCRFVSGDKEDVMVAATAVATSGITGVVFDRCVFGLGTARNKATHIDTKTNKIGTAFTQTDCAFIDCFINDDTVDTTAVKVDASGAVMIGLAGLDGTLATDALD